MKIVLQRVTEAAVSAQGQRIASIGRGLLVLVGIEKGDTAGKAQAMAEKVAVLRIFEDQQGKMNLSVADVKGELLVVSQFTVVADLTKGTRPSFDSAEEPAKAGVLIEGFVGALKSKGCVVREGRFGTRMQVSLVNDGPATFILG
ncbi:MAG: D-aminoacyl-tRNA deacylase [Candidatus Omnitrophica bacterium]|nr:D-aminoacyl-tRNA deacylase [Candidatus Omnitrophota bacterium]